MLHRINRYKLFRKQELTTFITACQKNDVIYLMGDRIASDGGLLFILAGFPCRIKTRGSHFIMRFFEGKAAVLQSVYYCVKTAPTGLSHSRSMHFRPRINLTNLIPAEVMN